MLDKRCIVDSCIYKELDLDKQVYWFDFKQKKFLHNIDTFYYSVKFYNDFTSDSDDIQVKKFREFFTKKREQLANDRKIEFLPLHFDELLLNLRPFSFAGMYNICLECPEWFDMFIAPSVPENVDAGESVTCEIVVQIRSYMLWMYGVHESFERSYEYVKKIADYFGLSIHYCQENRIDYCWHSNYLSKPERFFSLENFYKMRVDRFSDAQMHTEKKGSSGYEIDYVSMGKRSDKVFIRIYLKSKEVVEQGYKSWFFYIWLFNGLINRYDLYIYEECYKRRNWYYMNMARINFYFEYGSCEHDKLICRQLLDGTLTMEEDSLQQLADRLTPKVNLIMNVEYQTMRRHTKSYCLLPLRDNRIHITSKRIYDYLDNRKLIIDYLTRDVFRLVEPEGDVNKSRREMCSFWKSLRSCKMVDVHIPPKQLRLVREYSRKLNSDLVKTRAINSIIMHGLYTKGINDDDIMKDVMDALLKMNDNDIQKAVRYKNKRARQLNESELSGTLETTPIYDFGLVDKNTGEIYDYNNILMIKMQEDIPEDGGDCNDNLQCL